MAERIRRLAPHPGEVNWAQLKAEVPGCLAVNEVELQDGSVAVAGYFERGSAPRPASWAAAVRRHVPEAPPAPEEHPVVAALRVLGDEVTEALESAPNNGEGIKAAITAAFARALAKLA